MKGDRHLDAKSACSISVAWKRPNVPKQLGKHPEFGKDLGVLGPIEGDVDVAVEAHDNRKGG